MKEHIFTFGFGHVHPDTGRSLANHYIVIWAESAQEARTKMYERFGQKWAFEYPSREAAGVERFGLIELKE